MNEVMSMFKLESGKVRHIEHDLVTLYYEQLNEACFVRKIVYYHMAHCE